LKIIILGSNGLVGSAITRNLSDKNNNYEVITSTRKDTNLFSFEETKRLIDSNKPDVVINAAARVGGILANNTSRTEFILENLKININVLESIINYPEIKLINLGSSCIYPLNASNPIKEESLMTGALEPTNSPYAMAKLTAIEMGDALRKQYGHKIINLMPTNLYGPNDNFSENNSHVIPGLIFRLHETKENGLDVFTVWGTGKPKREFLHVDDLANAIKFIIQNDIEVDLLNIGSGEEVSINDLIYKIKDVVEFSGDIAFDPNMPDGNPRKLLDSSKVNGLGWKPSIRLEEGLVSTYTWFVNNFIEK